VNALLARIEEDGFAVIDRFFDESAVAELKSTIETSLRTVAGKGGVRNLLELPAMRNLSTDAAVLRLIEPILGVDARVVRGILFDKAEGANWKVPWHQDVTIAVSHKIDVEGYGPWSVKAGILHVQPPAAVLEKMISVRIHIDDCPQENGALLVIPGSHRSGKLPAVLPEDCRDLRRSVVCGVGSGGVLLMRPLLLHSSSAAAVPGHRRVIHFDYAAVELPKGMGWAASQA